MKTRDTWRRTGIAMLLLAAVGCGSKPQPSYENEPPNQFRGITKEAFQESVVSVAQGEQGKKPQTGQPFRVEGSFRLANPPKVLDTMMLAVVGRRPDGVEVTATSAIVPVTKTETGFHYGGDIQVHDPGTYELRAIFIKFPIATNTLTVEGKPTRPR